MDDERTLRLGVVLAGHLIYLSAGALRIVRGERKHWIEAPGVWVVRWYPPLVWLPLLAAVFLQPWRVPLAPPAPAAGLALATASALFAAWAMWSLGRSYGIGMDLFEGHRLQTGGAYGLVRHPMYVGILGYHVGASLALESLFLLAATLLAVLPFTVIRIVAEERVLAVGFGDAFERYRARTPALLPRFR